MLSAGARAYSNIAFIKYWGKADEELIIPNSSSLSMTLDCFYTDTYVKFSQDLREDQFYLDGQLQTGQASTRVFDFVDIFRKEASVDYRVTVRSDNHIPTAAGLASSASGFAALSQALNQALDLKLDREVLSTFARRGSGSATRSIYGGFVEWQKGWSNESSKAVKVDDGDFDIGLIIIIVNKDKKEISSRLAMKNTVESSPFYKPWLESSEEDLKAIKLAIKDRKLKEIGQIAERNSLMMHATMLGAKPPILYWQKESLEAMAIVKELRAEGIDCYFTMDAGPNVKLICRKSEFDIIVERLLKKFSSESIVKSGVGPGVASL